jgi:6,7-dimethyl-8-ribityllumazine synthase
MGGTIHGELRGDGLRLALLVARWNPEITERLLAGAGAACAAAGVAESDVTIVEVPGSFELPFAALAAARSGRFDAVVALGCVLRGETDHHEIIGRECARGCLDASILTGVPVTFGVVTADTPEQALARSDVARGAGGKGGHKGIEATEAAIRLVNLARELAGRPRAASTRSARSGRPRETRRRAGRGGKPPRRGRR